MGDRVHVYVMVASDGETIDEITQMSQGEYARSGQMEIVYGCIYVVFGCTMFLVCGPSARERRRGQFNEPLIKTLPLEKSVITVV